MRVVSKNLEVEQLCKLSIVLCEGDYDQTCLTIKELLSNGLSLAHIREVILTSYLFDGFPTALEGFRAYDEVTDVTGSPGRRIEFTPRNLSLWYENGVELCKLVYGDNYQVLMERVTRIAPELKDSMIIEGYGKVMSRTDLPIVYRELCIVAMLAYKNRQRQLISHTIGALRLGASDEDLRRVLTTIASFITTEQLLDVSSIVEEVIAKLISN